MRRTSLSSERKAPHELSEQTVLQEPCATSFFSIYPPDREQQRGDVLSLVRNVYDEYTNAQPFEELGNLLVPREQVTSVKY